MHELRLILVETKNEIYLRSFEYESYNRMKIDNYLFDGKLPKPCFKEGYVMVDTVPKKIQKYVSQPTINHRYELIDKSMKSSKFKLVFKAEEVCEKNSYYDWKSEFEQFRPLYEHKYDKVPDKLEDVRFEFTCKSKFETIKKMNGFSYPVQKSQWRNEGFINLTDEDVNYELINELVNPDIVLPMTPCSLSSSQSYSLIRKYIQDNINPKYAVITSDYDFCFTVKKKIKCEPIQYQVNTNGIFSKRKPKYVTRYKDHREVEVFEMTTAEKPYNNYTPIAGFKGKNLEDLAKNIKTYLENMIAQINSPVVDCPNCKGNGTIIEKVTAKI